MLCVILNNNLQLFFLRQSQHTLSTLKCKHMLHLESENRSPYMARRYRFFHYSISPPAHPQQMLNAQQWLGALGEAIQSSPSINLKTIRKLSSAFPLEVNTQFAEEVVEMLKLSLGWQQPSKISNTAYYLCRASSSVRRLTCEYLFNLVALSRSRSRQVSYSELVLLSDWFIFGISFTQSEFVNDIFPLTALSQYSLPETFLLLNYIEHYFQVLAGSPILNKRNREKVLGSIFQYLQMLVQERMAALESDMKKKQYDLRTAYISAKHSLNNAGAVDEAEQLFLQAYRKYADLLHRVNETIVVITGYEHTEKNEKNSEISIGGSLGEIETDAKFDSIGEDLKKYKLFGSNSFLGLSSRSNDDNESEQNQHKHLLEQIKKSCEYFTPNYSTQSQQIYHTFHPTLPEQQSYQRISYCSPFSSLKPREQLTAQYLQKVTNCTSISQSQQLITTFLTKFNKHSNRVLLVEGIFYGMWNRNNLDYIVSVLYGIALRETKQIRDILNEEIKKAKTGQHADRDRGDRDRDKRGDAYYRKQIYVTIEAIKFNILPAEMLLQEISEYLLNIGDCTIEPSSFRISIPQIINLLEKCDRTAYYQSLASHTMFNQIIDAVSHHIQNRIIGYEVAMTNRFNGFVKYLRSSGLKESNEVVREVISIEDLTEENRFRRRVKIMQKELNKFNKKESKEMLEEMMELLTVSINSQSYISNFHYADLIAEIGNEALTQAIAERARSNIINLFKHSSNAQGSVNWARFYGQLCLSLHKISPLPQQQLLSFLEFQIIDFSTFSPQTAAIRIKILCTILQACHSCLTSTTSVRKISESLLFLLKVKKHLLKIGGLKDNVLAEHEVVDMMSDFHAALAEKFKNVEECEQFENRVKEYEKVVQGGYREQCNVEKMMDELIAGNQQKSTKVTLKYKEVQPPTQYREKQTFPMSAVKQQGHPVKVQQMAIPKKSIKVIGRSKNGEKKVRQIYVNV